MSKRRSQNRPPRSESNSPIIFGGEKPDFFSRHEQACGDASRGGQSMKEMWEECRVRPETAADLGKTTSRLAALEERIQNSSHDETTIVADQRDARSLEILRRIRQNDPRHEA